MHQCCIMLYTYWTPMPEGQMNIKSGVARVCGVRTALGDSITGGDTNMSTGMLSLISASEEELNLHIIR